MDKSDPLAHVLLCFMYRTQGKYEKAIAEINTAIDLTPNSASSHYEMSRTMHFAGRPEEAIESIEKAMRLDPIYPATYLVYKGHSLHYAGRYEEAISAYEQYVERKRQVGEQIVWWIHFSFTAAYLELNQIVKASEHYKKALVSGKTKHDFIRWARNYTGYKDKDLERLKHLLEPLSNMVEGEVKAKLFVHKGTPAFNFKYPEGSKELQIGQPEQILKMQTPGGVRFDAYVADTPEGMKLEDFGPKDYLLELKKAGVGSNFDVISNESISLKDGTNAYKTVIKWMYSDGKTWVTTLLVSAYKEDNLVYLATHPTGDPEEVVWIVESLRFE